MRLGHPDRYDIVLSGTLAATTPTLIKRPDQKEGEPLMWTRIVAGSPVRVPVWPGETMKGAMRSAAFFVAVEAARRAGLDLSVLTLDRLYQQTKGGVEFVGRRGDLGGDDALRAAQPILSLFGSADPMLEGLLSIWPAQAVARVEALDLPGGARRDPLLASPDLQHLLSDAEKTKWAERQEYVRLVGRAKAAETDARRALFRARNTPGVDPAPFQADLEAAARAHAQARADPRFKASMQRPLDDLPAVPAGTVYTHRIAGAGMTAIETGFLLAILRTLPTLELGPRIGGGRTTGYGYYQADYAIALRPADDRPLRDRSPVPVGTLVMPEGGAAGEIRTGDARLIAAIAAWDEAEREIGRRFSIFAE